MEYTALIAFTVTTFGTPGPNNTMLMSSGLNYGVRLSLPHFLGIALGFPAMTLAVGLGFAELFEQLPWLHFGLKIAGVSYLCYLAFRIAFTPVTAQGTSAGKPLTFMQSCAFQWVNPKAWVMAIGAIVTFTSATGSYLYQVLTICLFFILFGAPCNFTWLWLGRSLQKWVQQPQRLQQFNWVMGALLLSSLVPVAVEIWRELGQ